MPMERDRHEELLQTLLNPELEQSKRTEILQELRADYSGVLTDFDTLSNTNAQLQKNNNDLIISNSQLFRQAGIVGQPDDKKKEEELKEFSETITIEELERGAN